MMWPIGGRRPRDARPDGTHDQEAEMEEQFVWVTTRRIKSGTLADFEHAWRPDPFPEGLRRAFAYWSEDNQEVTGVSFWESKEACEAWRGSEAEARRREAMLPYVVEEREAFYRGRELGIPGGGGGA
jgi:heme-degrading monooxygenase HmoA